VSGKIPVTGKTAEFPRYNQVTNQFTLEIATAPLLRCGAASTADNPMNKSDPSKGKPLNLGKFKPSPDNEQPQTPPEGEGETMFIRRTTAATVESKLEPAERQSAEFGLPVKEMLGVITYCYARGVFNSGEIAARLKKEPELRKAVGGNLPDEATIRRFRRKYAGEIEDALELLYQHFPPQAVADKPEDLAHKHASSRVHDAIWTDNKLPGRPLRD
jgi:hypothetical protein